MGNQGPLYDAIGLVYDNTRRADPEITGAMRRLLPMRPSYVYLDVGCGTGNYTVALASYGGRWMGVDESARMIEVAREKLPRSRGR